MDSFKKWVRSKTNRDHYDDMATLTEGTEDDMDNMANDRGLRHRRRHKKKVYHLPALSDVYESLDYELMENELVKKEETSRKHTHLVFARNRNRWIVSFLIGFFTATLAVIVYASVRVGVQLKFQFISSVFGECSQSNCLWMVLLYWCLINMGCVLVSTCLCVFVSPVAVGSGIPQIKCFLNGVRIPMLLRFKTLVAKIIGVIGSVVGGLAVGKEGPMAHAGACVAGGISQGRLITFPLDLKIFNYFRTDREKRDFVSAGTAAGVAAAFNAPIGGVLFSLEEGASFWTQQVTWRTFFCSMTCYFFLNLFLSLLYGKNPGNLSWSGLADFGVLDPTIDYAAWEMPVFLLMGVIGGLSGALFNALNSRLTLFRMNYMKAKWTKVVEALLIAALSGALSFCWVFSMNHCTPISSFSADASFANFPVQLYCPDGEYNGMSQTTFETPESTVRWFFHHPEQGFNAVGLLCFIPIYFLLACLTYGCSVSSGLFIPLMLVGAGWGRLVARGMQTLIPSQAAFLVSSKYAIVGSGAQLSGSLRMTISICVILMESVQSLRIGMPLMLAMMVAKWVGDRFNTGIYDTHIDLMEIPILPWQPPETATIIPATTVMSSPVKVIRRREKVRTVLDILRSGIHHGYPVVSDFSHEEARGRFNPYRENWEMPNNFGQLEGFIMRHQLIVLLNCRAFSPEWADQLHVLDAETMLTSEDFRKPYPRYSETLEKLHLTPDDLNSWLDVTPFMDPAPYIATADASLRKLFRLFRRLGLRHVVIVSKEHRVLGVVTRKDIARFREQVDPNKKKLRLREVHIRVSHAESAFKSF